MPANMFMVAVDWYGPLKSLSEAREVSQLHRVKDFLYLGFQRKGRHRSYVGISNNAQSRLRTSHQVLGRWPDGTYQLWLGIVVSQSEPGRRASASPPRHKAALTFAERLTARFVQTSDNVQGSKKPPKRSGALLNRWYYLSDGFPRHKRRPHKNWPDFIDFEETEGLGRTAYFAGKVDFHYT
jgi:hypothetical protein